MTYTKHFMGGEFTHYSVGDDCFVETPGNRDYEQMLVDVADDPSCLTKQDNSPVFSIADQLMIADEDMPRTMEDVVDAIVANGGAVAQETLNKVQTKKALRAQL
jgi:hypothetical protein